MLCELHQQDGKAQLEFRVESRPAELQVFISASEIRQLITGKIMSRPGPGAGSGDTATPYLVQRLFVFIAYLEL